MDPTTTNRSTAKEVTRIAALVFMDICCDLLPEGTQELSSLYISRCVVRPPGCSICTPSVTRLSGKLLKNITPGGLQPIRAQGLNVTDSVVRTETGRPFRLYGLNFHFFTPSIASRAKAREP